MTPHIHPTAIVAAGATLEEGVTIGAYSLIGPHVVLKENVKIHPHVLIDGHTTIGAETEIFPFAAIGLPPQNIHYKGEPSSLEIGKKCVIREHVTIHPGTEKGGMKTTLGEECYIMVGAHIAHDCHVGQGVIMANNATLGGHVHVGNYSIIGGLAAVHQFVRIGSYAMISGTAGVGEDVIPFGTVLTAKSKLGGLNIIGMKRRGFEREEIHALRHAYNLLVREEDGTLGERLKKIKTLHGHYRTVEELVAFIDSDPKRPLCLPSKKWGGESSDDDDKAQRIACA